jgi:Bacterial extracellular solute-binding proteins, family 3
MFFRVILVLLILAAVIDFSAVSHADDNASPVINVLVGLDPPNSFFDETGQVVGSAVSQVRAFMELSGLNFEINLMPWARAYREVTRRHDTLIFNIGRTMEREDQFHWILPLSTFVDSLVSRNTPEMERITRDDILAGTYQAACERATMQCQSLLNYGFPEDRIMQVSEVSADKLARLVLRRRVDFIAINMTALGQDPDERGIDKSQLLVISEINTTVAYLAAPIGFDPQALAALLATPQGNPAE